MRRVLFMMPNWNEPSELFVQRQIRMLADAGVLEAVITNDSGGAACWDERIPVISLHRPTPMTRYRQAIRHRLGPDSADNAGT
jgi:hypothetical protein